MLIKVLDLNDTEKGRDPRTVPRGTNIERGQEEEGPAGH